MRIIKKGNAIKERTYLVLIDIFILMCAMGVSLGILFITLSPAFGLVESRGGSTSPERGQPEVTMKIRQAVDRKCKSLPDTIKTIDGIYRSTLLGWFRLDNQRISKKSDRLLIFIFSAAPHDSAYVDESKWNGTQAIATEFNEADLID